MKDENSLFRSPSDPPPSPNPPPKTGKEILWELLIMLARQLAYGYIGAAIQLVKDVWFGMWKNKKVLNIPGKHKTDQVPFDELVLAAQFKRADADVRGENQKDGLATAKGAVPRLCDGEYEYALVSFRRYVWWKHLRLFFMIARYLSGWEPATANEMISLVKNGANLRRDVVVGQRIVAPGTGFVRMVGDECSYVATLTLSGEKDVLLSLSDTQDVFKNTHFLFRKTMIKTEAGQLPAPVK